jgi:hypothetical protein
MSREIALDKWSQKVDYATTDAINVLSKAPRFDQHDDIKTIINKAKRMSKALDDALGLIEDI